METCQLPRLSPPPSSPSSTPSPRCPSCSAVRPPVAAPTARASTS
ncbi:hypothetical protein [Ornithinimicrobium kibberense]